MRLGNGLADVRAMLERRVNVGIGTDGANCSDNLNMYESMRLASMVSKTQGPDTDRWLTTGEVLTAATEGSARALGFGDKLGRIAPGYKADITLLSLRDPAFAPLNDAVRQLVYAEAGRSVRHVIVDGRLVLEEGRATTIDEDALYAEIERLMPTLLGDLAAIRSRNEQLLPYVEEAHRRTMALDFGLDRYRTI
jgi:guanine deaminase